MSMNRVIHGAVRRDLARLESALTSVPDGDRGRAKALGRAYSHLREELVRHHQGEDELIFPMLRGFEVDPILLGEMEAEHAAMDEALADTDAAMATYAATGTAPAAEEAHASVGRTRRVVERHLDHEEAELEPLFHPYEDTEEWHTVERRLRRQPPRVAGQFMAWVQDGMGEEERAYFDTAVPKPARFVLTKVFGRGYRREIAPVWQA